MLVPKFEWKPFDKNNPPSNLDMNGRYLILLREDDYNKGKTWSYSVDVAEPYGSYIDNFWNTDNDWREGQLVEVVAYAEFPYSLRKDELIDDRSFVEDPVLKGLHRFGDCILANIANEEV